MKHIFIFLFTLSMQHIFSQLPDIVWEHSFGGNSYDEANDIIETIDGGFLSVGNTISSDGDIPEAYGETDIFVVKTDMYGSLEWAKTYGGTWDDECFSVCIAIDGGYLLGGSTNSDDGDVSEGSLGTDFWIIKISEAGEIEWEKTFGGSGIECANQIIQTQDGNYMVAGWTSSSDGDVSGHHGSDDYWLLKIDQFGTLLWQHCYGSSEFENANDILETSEGCFIVVGNTWGSDGDVSYNHGFSDYWVIKIDSSGNLLWEHSYGGTKNDAPFSVLEKQDHSLLISGYTNSEDGDISGTHGSIDIWVISIDSIGNLQWQKCYGGSAIEYCYSSDIFSYDENTFIISGLTHSSDGDISENKGNADYWLVSIDSVGEVMWQKTIGGTAFDGSYSVIVTSDSTIVTTGLSRSSNYDVSPSYLDYNYWTVKLGWCTDIYYADLDADGYGNSEADTLLCYPIAGYVIDSSDCNDLVVGMHPGAKEVCNFLDDNCNGLIDEGITYFHLYLDADGDGYGTEEYDSLFCDITEGFSFFNTDCDDSNASVYPGAEEIINNGIDEDCDGNDLLNHISHINSESLFTFYPNPTEGKFIFRSSLKNYSDLNVVISQIDGMELFSKKILSSEQMINVSHLSAGTYFIFIVENESVIYQHILLIAK